MKSSPLSLGDTLPSFRLPNQDGKVIEVNTKDQKSSFRLIYFYPKNNTKICTAQACGWNSKWDELKVLDCQIYGISSDSISSQERFSAKHQLKFNLLSDSNGEVRKLFGARSFFGLVPKRASYLCDSEGKILYTADSLLHLDQHIDEIIQYLKTKP